jgi:hypothetical protein
MKKHQPTTKPVVKNLKVKSGIRAGRDVDIVPGQL